MYQEIIPTSGTKNGIESFWVFQESTEPIAFKVLPDSCIDLILDLNSSSIFLSGLMTQFQNRSLEKDVNIIGIRMRAENFPFLTKLPIAELKNKRVALPM